MLAGCAGFNQRERSPDVERGRYVVEIMGCNNCHTPNYMGSVSVLPDEDWLVLARQMRQDSPVTWVWLPKVSERDLRAVHRFVRYLGPKGRPAPARLPAGVSPTTDHIEFPDPH